MIKFVVTPQHMAPKGWTCEACRLKIKPGQVVFEIKTKFDRTAIHKHCVMNLMDSDPEIKDQHMEKKLQEEQRLKEKFELIRESYSAYSV
jgi:hypothetical protein